MKNVKAQGSMGEMIDSAWMWVSGCGVSKSLTKIKIQIKREDKKTGRILSYLN